MNRITSASCSIAPDSRRSDITGRLSVRDSRLRFSCDIALTDRLHQLQIVDDDRAQLAAVLARQPPRPRAKLERVQRPGVIDMDRRVVESAQRARQPLPVVVRQAAGADLLLVEA